MEVIREIDLNNIELKLESSIHMEESLVCEICRDPAENECNYCSDTSHPGFCDVCLHGYIEHKVNDAFLGSCPTIYCPATNHHKAESSDSAAAGATKPNRRILSFKKWSNSSINRAVVNKYLALANSLLVFTCGGCHSAKTLDVGADLNLNSSCSNELRKQISDVHETGDRLTEVDRFTELTAQFIPSYELGEIGVEELYGYIITTLFPNLLSIPNFETAWSHMKNILKLIENPERRVNLHLRYLRDRPRIKTLCCSKEHCFKCKTKDYHDGKTCEEMTSTLDQGVVTCPSCNIAIARGDGCNTITCVCGIQFSWTTEKENTERSFEFLRSYPENTSDKCAEIVFTSISSLDAKAKAWQNRHRFEVNASLLKRFRNTFGPYPSQVCAKLSSGNYAICPSIISPQQAAAEGMRQTVELWKNQYSKEVSHFANQNKIASRTIFQSMVRDMPATLRTIEAQSIIRQSHKDRNDTTLVRSAQLWIDENKAEYDRNLEKAKETSANQFLFLYGNKKIASTTPEKHNPTLNAYLAGVGGTMKFNSSLSCSDLEFTNDYTTVERPGSVSCYPAAFVNITTPRAYFKITIEAAPRSSNWLTFGVAKRGQMANTGSDGVGRTSDTWGFSDDRGSSSEANFYASRSHIASCRKLQEGDTLSAVVDTIDGWLEIALNESEVVQRIVIPMISDPSEYMFAMSFANDHRVRIISDFEDSFTSNKASTVDGKVVFTGTLNTDHTKMYQNLRTELVRILNDINRAKTASSLTMDSISSFLFENIPEQPKGWLDFCLKKNGRLFQYVFQLSNKVANNKVEIPSKSSEEPTEVSEVSGSDEKSKQLPVIEASDVNDFCAQVYNLVLPHIENYFGLSKTKGARETTTATTEGKEPAQEEDLGSKIFAEFCWNDILHAIRWYLANLERIERKAKETRGMTYAAIHGENAPFMAAMTLRDFHNSAKRDEEVLGALAYMSVFTNEMEDWYVYNAELSDPIVENIAKGCRCFPRHIRTCPVVAAARK